MGRSTKRHHYIPQFVLRLFRDARGHLHLFDKINQRMYQGTPNNVFFEKHLYSVFDPLTQGRDDTVERDLSAIEHAAAPVIQKIVRSVRSRHNPHLSELERYRWAHFYHAQSRRTLENLASCLEDDDRLSERAEALGISLHEIDRVVMTHALPLFAGGASPRLGVEKYCRNVGLMSAVILRPKRGFVIGSSGVPLGANEPDIFYRGWLPLAPDVAVRATKWSNKEILVTIPRHASVVIQRMNLTAALHSRIVGGSSEADLRVVIRRLEWSQ